MVIKSPVTMQQMCETIVRADFLRKKDGSKPTAIEIWEYSPTGEISAIFGWYELAILLLETETNLNPE